MSAWANVLPELICRLNSDYASIIVMAENSAPAGDCRSKSTRQRMRAVAVKRFRERHSDRFSVLRERNFRRFCIGYSTSLFGTAMSSVAIAFAVLGSGGTATELGLVFAAGIVPQVALMLGGGLAADRLGSRRVMLAADAARCCAQAGLAAAVLLGRPPVWVFVALAFVVGTGDAVF
ncbi:MAG: MFS transporter, partial [Streptosporangiaceae bacterium]